MAMNKQRRTSNINNIVVYDAAGNVTLPAGLTITGLNTAGFVKTNASGVFSIDTAAYITLASAITGYSVGANTALAAADTLLAALGKIQGQLNARSGTVTSVALSLPAIFSVSGSPVTTTGTLSATLASQTANQFFAAPNGAAGAPVFRAIVAADVPALNYQAPLNGTGFVKATGATISYDNSTYYLASNPSGYTTNTGTVTSVSGTGTVSGLTLSGTVTSSGTLTLGGTLSLTSGNVTTALGYTPYNATNPNGYISSYTEVDTLATVTARGNIASGSIQANNFYDATGSYNVNLGSAGNEGRGVVAGYSGSSYSGLGYNVRHTTTGDTWIAPGPDTSSYILFTAGGFIFYGAPGGVAGRTLSYTTLGSFSAAGTFNAVNLTVNGNQTLHHANWNSYAPSLTGTGASGTWGINVTGSAGSVVVDNTVSYGRSGLQFAQSSGPAGNTANAHQTPTGDWWHVLRMNHSNGDGYYSDLAVSMTTNLGLARRVISGGSQLSNWVTILDALNYNSYTPTLTGTGASGTWGISITGNALTATSTTLLKSVGDYPWSQSTLPVSYSTGMQLAFVGPASGEGLWQNYGTVINARSYSSGGGGSLQMYVPYSPTNGGNALQVRFGDYNVSNGNSWTAWKTLLQSDNYNSYAPTLTGTGASGTWGINITGSANSANSATNALRIVFEDGPRNLSDRLPTTLARSVNFDFVGAGVVGGSGNYAGVMSFTPWTGTSSSTGDSSYQLAFINETSINGAGLPGLRLRKGIDTTWGDWYTLLHAGNYNSYAPSLTGVGASGTWGISISGSAAQLGGIGSGRAILKRRTRISATDSTYLDSSIVSAEMGFTYGGSGEPTGPFIAFGGLSGDIDYSCQLVGAYGGGGNNFTIRTRNDDAQVWNPWRTLITDGNYTSYSPTLTGTGASGTWGISISGNAASSSTVTVSAGNNTGAWFPIVWHSGNYLYSSSGLAEIYPAAGYARFSYINTTDNDVDGISRFVVKNGDDYHRSATTTLAADTIRGVASGTWSINVTGNAATVSDGMYLSPVQYVTGIKYFKGNKGSGVYLSSTDSATLQALSDDSGTAFMSFHRGGYYAVNMGLDPDNVMRIGGWSAAANRWQLDMSGNMTVAGDVTAYSDARVKENVITVEDALTKVLRLRGVYYNRTDSDDKRRKLGVIAQEILEVIPEVVGQDNNGMYNVSYGNVVGVLIEAIKEQQTQIEDLKKQIQYLVENK